MLTGPLCGLNRPDARNAMSDELVADLRAQLAYIATRADIRGLTIRGRGDVFAPAAI